MPDKDPFAAYQKPLATSEDDPFAAYQNPLPYRPPDTVSAGPGFIERQKRKIQSLWGKANAPILERENPKPGTLSEQYMKERQRLQGWYGVGPEAETHNLFRIKHPILASGAATLASVEDRAADLLSPALIVTAGTGPVVQGFLKGMPEAAGIIKAISPYAKWSTAGVYGVGGVGNIYEGAKTGNLSEMAGGATMMFPLIGEGLTAAGGKAFNPIRPKVVKIAGVDVPLLSGEADPMSFGASAEAGLKTGGFGSKKFMQFAEKQQEAVKTVISKMSQEIGGLTSSISDEPGAEVANAANDVLEKARPMYQALDASMETVPDAFQNANSIVKTAIGRANKLGLDIDTSASTPYYESGGNKFGPGTALYESAKKAGLPEQGTGLGGAQPLTTFIKVKSELLKMARMSNDPAHKYAIFNEVKAMDEGMEKALQGTPLYGNYKEASRLWAKGRSLQEISEEIRKSTTGVPAALQHPDLAKIPTEIQGSNLVSRLNDLYQEGTLAKAFSFSETQNLFRAADILDRASVKVGRFGVPIHGYGGHSTMYDAVKRLGLRPFINVMTTVNGVDAVKALADATTQAGQERALNVLATIAAELSTPKKQTLGEVKKQAEKINLPSAIKADERKNGNSSTGPQSSIPSTPKDMMAKANELQDMFHSSGFSSQPSQPSPPEGTGPQSSLKPTHRYDETTQTIVTMV